MKREIKKQKFRYIIPFAYEPGKAGVDALCGRLTADNGKNGWCYEGSKQGEQDIYGLFEDTFRPDRKNQENIGYSLKYTARDENGEILRITYMRGEELPEYAFRLKDVGLYLFRTGIGLFWYEIEKQDSQTEMSDAEDLLLFQNRFKELNRCAFPWYDVKNPQYDEQGRKKPNYVAGFLLGDAQTVDEGITMGYWINTFLKQLDCEVQFYPDRIYCEDKSVRVPDKALLFNYVVAEGESEDIEELAYYLSSGYNRSYLVPEGIRERMFQPFTGAYWYGTREGCGYYIQNNPGSEFFFTNTMPRKIENDYFVLYILLLYQSYTLLHYTNKIERGMSADFHVYKEADPEITEWLENFETEINVFLIKSVYSSVSHIQHQNGFYEYISKQLRIREDIDSIMLGLRSLDELQQIRQNKKDAEKQKKDVEQEEKISTALSVLSLLAIISAFVDGFGLVDQMTIYFRGTGWTPVDYILHIGVFAVIFIIGFFTVKSVWRAIIKMFKDEIHKKSS